MRLAKSIESPSKATVLLGGGAGKQRSLALLSGGSCNAAYAWSTLANFRLGDVNLEYIICKGIIIEHADRLVCFSLIGHGDKSETL
jgi:hypothetical protein